MMRMADSALAGIITYQSELIRGVSFIQQCMRGAVTLLPRQCEVELLSGTTCYTEITAALNSLHHMSSKPSKEFKDLNSYQPTKTLTPNHCGHHAGYQTLLLHKPWSYTSTMIWAACCLAFFGFLSVSEFTIPVQDQYDQSCHLSFNDVSFDNRDNPHMLKSPSNNPKQIRFARVLIIIYLSATGHTLCPIRGILP